MTEKRLTPKQRKVVMALDRRISLCDETTVGERTRELLIKLRQQLALS